MELTQEIIASMNVDELANSVVDLYETRDALKREILAMSMEGRARQLGALTAFQKVLKQADKAYEDFNSPAIQSTTANDVPLSINNKTGKPDRTIENFLAVMHYDPFFTTVRFNEFTLNTEYTENLKKKIWTDDDDSVAIRHIQTRYSMYDEPMFRHAWRVLMKERSYHPVRERINAVKWDGVDRVSKFLLKWMNCVDTPYTRELSRLIFAGGIHRIYDPGCKFDNVIVLIGKHQGEGKSSFVRWIAIDDSWYSELTEIDGPRGIEAIQGTFVCEVSEMLAMVKAREVESIKAYFSRQVDKYRLAYGHRTGLYQRQCIFIGTTNREQFLTDKTGNRRFFPVHVNINGHEVFKNEIAIKEDVLQCWAEAKAKYDSPFMSPEPDYGLSDEFKRQQRAAVEDDWREDAIEEYLASKKNGESVCIEELWFDALENSQFNSFTKGESAELAIMMQRFDDWTRPKDPIYFKKYGSRRGWIKECDDVPF